MNIEKLRRNYMGDVPKIVDEPYTDGTRASIPQQVGFITEDEVEIQMSYERALERGLIDKDEFWTMRKKDYMRDSDL